MIDFKEMTIPKPRVSTLPKLELNGKWLMELGFKVGDLVNVVFTDNCLTLTTEPLNASSVITITSKMIRKHPRIHLILEWWILKQADFHVGNRLVLYLTPNMIQISRIA